MEYYQEDVADKNRNKILIALFEKPMTFTELRKEVKLSKPVLSNHLKYLRERNQVTKDLSNNKVAYRLTHEALDLSTFRWLTFKNEMFFRILSEMIDEDDEFSSSFKTKSRNVLYDQYQEKRSPFFHIFPKPEFISSKEDDEIIQAINKWLTPIILYTIIQDSKAGNGLIQIAYDLIQRLTEIIKQKNMKSFEIALKKHFKDNLVSLYFLLIDDKLIPVDEVTEYDKETKVSVVGVLEEIFESMKVQERINKK